ncbi:Chitinase class I family protein [Reticulomyxa filosa]|uniref:Chitinase class I family protein n=1 Tax=Reticulomyxa filosa TaxID=46433 RepID=X6NU33_RETFI|nr:Chitinase class I family protein [Reticulomyxa filosa]|eukprot:ETO29805.1 Chitinase class I family protein [Reticulomyxa filosa]
MQIEMAQKKKTETSTSFAAGTVPSLRNLAAVASSAPTRNEGCFFKSFFSTLKFIYFFLFWEKKKEIEEPPISPLHVKYNELSVSFSSQYFLMDLFERCGEVLDFIFLDFENITTATHYRNLLGHKHESANSAGGSVPVDSNENKTNKNNNNNNNNNNNDNNNNNTTMSNNDVPMNETNLPPPIQMLVLYQKDPTWSGRVPVKYKNIGVMGIVLNVMTNTWQVLFDLPNYLPYEFFKLVPVPGFLKSSYNVHVLNSDINPILSHQKQGLGGAFIVSPHALLHFNERSVDFGISLNEHGDDYIADFPVIRKWTEKLTSLEECPITPLLTHPDHFLLSDGHGNIYLLSLEHRRMDMTWVAHASIMTCITTLNQGYVFFGSRLGDSLLLRCQTKSCDTLLSSSSLQLQSTTMMMVGLNDTANTNTNTNTNAIENQTLVTTQTIKTEDADMKNNTSIDLFRSLFLSDATVGKKRNLSEMTAIDITTTLSHG